MPAEKFKAVVAQHRPTGYQVKERKMRKNDGQALFIRRITVNPIVDRHTLAVFLHECGHVHHRHICDGATPAPTWRIEYEADKYAIDAMRAAGIPFPRDTLRAWKEVVGEFIHGEKTHPCDDEEVLRYAFGKDWRKHRG